MKLLKETTLTYNLSSNFEYNYKRIKENCKKHSGLEAKGVSEILKKHSYLSNNNIVVLDIEVSMESIHKENSQDRIDLLLFNKETQTLQFVEAKHFSNKEIWAKNTPAVISQISKYKKQIVVKEREILSRYEKHISSLNRIFEISLPTPKKIDYNVTLLIFGFDTDQLKGRINELIINKTEYKGKGLSVYLMGSISNIKINTLWKKNSKTL